MSWQEQGVDGAVMMMADEGVAAQRETGDDTAT